MTDSPEYALEAQNYGAEVPGLRPADTASDLAHDYLWVTWAINEYQKNGVKFDAFAILRPTSPFRTAGTIERAMAKFKLQPDLHSLRAVENCSQHPGKMWVASDEYIVPLLPFSDAGTPWHSSPTQRLPPMLSQNACIEIAYTSVLTSHGNISGSRIAPFYTRDYEGLDINSELDWLLAEYLVLEGFARTSLAPTDS